MKRHGDTPKKSPTKTSGTPRQGEKTRRRSSILRPPATPLGEIIRGYEIGAPSHPPPGFEGRVFWKDGVYVGNRRGITFSAADEDLDFEG